MTTSTRAILVAFLAIVVIGGGGLWYLFFRPSGPAPVTQPSQAPSSSSVAGGPTSGPTASGGSSLGPSTAGAPGSGASAASAAAQAGSSGAAAGGLAGTWKVDASIGKLSDFSNSFVGYRVQEQLANIGANTAVGRTPDVTGTLTLDSTNVTAAEFSAKLAGLVSDDRQRDGRVTDALNTRQFPTTTFVLGSPIQLGSLPSDGQELKVTASGKMTIRGVTHDVQFALTAKLSGKTLTVKGALEIKLADFGIPKPSSFLVLSIADTGIIEVQLQMTRG